MFEVSLLIASAIIFPPGPYRLAWSMFFLLLAIPGVYAMFRGAPFVPSSNATVKRMIGLAQLKKGERAYDLGCGDGRIVFAAAAKGALATGYELSFPTFVIAWLRSLRHKGATIRFRDFWRVDISDADVVFCYLLTGPMAEFEARIWPTLKSGCRVVSHAFRLKGIEPTQRDQDALIWIKP